MTIQDFAASASDHPFMILLFYGFIIVFAILAGLIGKNEGHLSPWKYLYSALIYLTCVPAIFIICLGLYAVSFERASVLNIDLVTQILPVVAMMATLFIAKANVSLDRIPGFGKISGLILMIFSASILMMILRKMRLLIFSYMPIQQVGLIFLVIFAVIYFGWRKMMKSQ